MFPFDRRRPIPADELELTRAMEEKLFELNYQQRRQIRNACRGATPPSSPRPTAAVATAVSGPVLVPGSAAVPSHSTRSTNLSTMNIPPSSHHPAIFNRALVHRQSPAPRPRHTPVSTYLKHIPELTASQQHERDSAIADLLDDLRDEFPHLTKTMEGEVMDIYIGRLDRYLREKWQMEIGARAAGVQEPGSLFFPWCPKIRAQEAEQKRLKDAEQKKKMMVKARAQDKIFIETFGNEKTELANKGAVGSSYHCHERDTDILTFSDSVRSVAKSEFASSSLFLPQHDSRPSKSRQNKNREIVDLVTPSPPHRKLSGATFSNSAACPEPSNTKNKNASAGRKRVRESEVEDDLPPKRPAHNNVQGGGVSRAQGDTGPGADMRETPRRKFLTALVRSKAKAAVMLKVTEL
ncbi:hypothetical protein BKA64DRAFT_714815 [Cadophora sp. MPI-SDFR-AT-0126]|nr:hypothetical protein BKA64DRAFT_714815 [Leotiomycetes sp. MPI-SDFR-AT-0126]